MPAGRLQAGERASAVRDAIPALPEELRKPLLILAGYQGMPQADIGAVLKCSAKAVDAELPRQAAIASSPGTPDTALMGSHFSHLYPVL